MNTSGKKPGKTPCTECIIRQLIENPREFPSISEDMNDSNKKNNFYEQPGIPGINMYLWEIALKTIKLSLQT